MPPAPPACAAARWVCVSGVSRGALQCPDVHALHERPEAQPCALAWSLGRVLLPGAGRGPAGERFVASCRLLGCIQDAVHCLLLRTTSCLLKPASWLVAESHARGEKLPSGPLHVGTALLQLLAQLMHAVPCCPPARPPSSCQRFVQVNCSSTT